MITVVVEMSPEGSYKAFTCMGHADYAKKKLFGRSEPDILCAGVSTLVFHTLNGLTQIANEDIDISDNEETGFIRCIFKKDLSDGGRVLMDSMMLSLKELSSEYGDKYLQVTTKEV